MSSSQNQPRPSWQHLAAGSLALAGSQWLILVLLSRSTTVDVVGRYALLQAWILPIYALANLQLRALMASDPDLSGNLPHFARLRVAGVALLGSLLLLPSLLEPGGDQWALLVYAASAPKFLELASDFRYGILLNQQHHRLIGHSQMLRGAFSTVGFLSAWWMGHSLLFGFLGQSVGVALAVLLADRSVLGLMFRHVRGEAAQFSFQQERHEASTQGALVPDLEDMIEVRHRWPFKRGAALRFVQRSPGRVEGRPQALPARPARNCAIDPGTSTDWSRLTSCLTSKHAGVLQLLTQGLMLAVVMALNTAMLSVPRILLASLAGLHEVAVFSCAASLVALVSLATAAYAAAYSPLFGLAAREPSRRSFFRLLGRVGFPVLVVGILLLPLVALFGSSALQAVFGPPYALSPQSAFYFSLFGLAWCLSTIVGTAATAARWIGHQMAAFGIGLLVSLLLGWMVIPSHGAEGAALSLAAGSLAMILFWVCLAAQFHRLQGETPYAPVQQDVSREETGGERVRHLVDLSRTQHRRENRVARICAKAEGMERQAFGSVHKKRAEEPRSPIVGRVSGAVGRLLGFVENAQRKAGFAFGPMASSRVHSSRPRILHVCGALDVGGAEVWLLRMLQSGGQAEDYCVLSLSARTGNLDPSFRAAGIAVSQLPLSRNPLSVLWQLTRHLRSTGPWTVVHAHVFRYSALVLLAAKLAGVRGRVAHCHHAESAPLPWKSFAAWVKHVVISRLLRTVATARIAVSHEAACTLFGAVADPALPVAVLPCGVDPEQIWVQPATPSLRDRYDIPRDAFVLAHVGRFAPVKNHALVLQIASQIASLHPNAYFLFLGDGPLRRDILQLASTMGIAGRCRFPGNVSNVAETLRSCASAFILASHSEGVSVAAIEAQIAGVPCLLADHLSSSGILLPERTLLFSIADDPRHIARLVLTHAQRIRHSLSDEDIALVRQSPFTIHRNRQQLLTIYRESGISVEAPEWNPVSA